MIDAIKGGLIQAQAAISFIGNSEVIKNNTHDKMTPKIKATIPSHEFLLTPRNIAGAKLKKPTHNC